MCRLCKICVRIVISTIAAFMSVFVSLKTLLENKLNKARRPSYYQICYCNAVSANITNSSVNKQKILEVDEQISDNCITLLLQMNCKTRLLRKLILKQVKFQQAVCFRLFELNTKEINLKRTYFTFATQRFQ